MYKKDMNNINHTTAHRILATPSSFNWLLLLVVEKITTVIAIARRIPATHIKIITIVSFLSYLLDSINSTTSWFWTQTVDSPKATLWLPWSHGVSEFKALTINTPPRSRNPTVAKVTRSFGKGGFSART